MPAIGRGGTWSAQRKSGIDQQSGRVDLAEGVEPRCASLGEAGELAPTFPGAHGGCVRHDLVVTEPGALQVEHCRGNLASTNRAGEARMQRRPIGLKGALRGFVREELTHTALVGAEPDRPTRRPAGPVPYVQREADDRGGADDAGCHRRMPQHCITERPRRGGGGAHGHHGLSGVGECNGPLHERCGLPGVSGARERGQTSVEVPQVLGRLLVTHAETVSLQPHGISKWATPLPSVCRSAFPVTSRCTKCAYVSLDAIDPHRSLRKR